MSTLCQGRILKDYRKMYGLSQKRLARFLKVEQPTISYWEKEHRTCPKMTLFFLWLVLKSAPNQKTFLNNQLKYFMRFFDEKDV